MRTLKMKNELYFYISFLLLLSGCAGTRPEMQDMTIESSQA